MKRKDIFIIIITFIFLIIIISLSYAYFALNTNLTNNIAQNISFDDDAYQIEVSNRNATPITISNYAMMWSGQDELVANTTENFIINITNNLGNAIYCSYDIVWEWKTGTGISNYTITSGATKEYTVSWDGNAEVQVPNYNASSFVLGKHRIGPIYPGGASIDVPVDVKFYNLANFNQSNHYNKTYLGYVKLDNIVCSTSISFIDYISYLAPKSGTNAVSNSPWILTEDHPGEYRYAGKNPDNYVQFNGELWRIIGVMPNTTYCTGTYRTETECDTTKTGSLVKIIRNQTISSSTLIWDYKQSGVGSSTYTYGSNDWSDSQLMLMLNGTSYLITGYDVNGNKLHQSYTITSNVVAGNGYNYYNATYSYLDGTGTTVYKPSSATTSAYTATSGTLYKKIESAALNQIATVKWDLYGTNSFTTAAEGSPAAFYNKERNIGNTGAVYNVTATGREKRAVYWYGKIGLMYPSDYGYSTGGGTTYDRNTCLGYQMSGWSSGSYKTDCALNSYLLFQNITSIAPGTSGTNQWTMSPISGNAASVFFVPSTGYMDSSYAYRTYVVRPVLYLKADTIFSGGNGTWNNPYIIE